jgi:hypothetical protein
MKGQTLLRSATVLALILLSRYVIAGEPPFPGTDAAATNLLKQFVKPGADGAMLSKQLRPSSGDVASVFEPDLAAKLDTAYQSAWDAGKFVVAPNPGQTEVKISSATSDELRMWTGAAMDFPAGWKTVAAKLKPRLKIYRFKFVEPGKDIGMAYDGLIYINGAWRIFPKPWRALQ